MLNIVEKEVKPHFPNRGENFDLVKMKFIICGLTGSGKSCVANYLTGNNNWSNIGSGAYSQTTKVEESQSPYFLFNTKYYSFDIVDTIGFNAIDFDDQDVLSSLLSTIRQETKLTGVIFTIKMGRLSRELASIFQGFRQFWNKYGFPEDRITVLLTYCDDNIKEDVEKCIQEVMEIIDMPRENFVAGCFRAISKTQSMLEKAYVPLVDNSVDILKEHLSRSPVSINISSYVLDFDLEVISEILMRVICRAEQDEQQVLHVIDFLNRRRPNLERFSLEKIRSLQ